MFAYFIAEILGLMLLLWSADYFIEGSAATAHHFGMPPLLIGMVIVGFGTSAPEMLVSALAASQGNTGLALGNAYGSNITNIALVLGLTALINPIAVSSQVLRKELPTLAGVTALAAWQFRDGRITRLDAMVLLSVFGVLLAWTVRQGLQKKSDAFGDQTEREMSVHGLPIRGAIFRLVAGLILLLVSSRILVWGAAQIARGFGVSDLIIGLTIVALGNVLGSNLFNTLAVVGIAGTIQPMEVGPEFFNRDISVMAGLTFSLFVLGYGFRGPGRINRIEGAALLACYAGYNLFLIRSVCN